MLSWSLPVVLATPAPAPPLVVSPLPLPVSTAVAAAISVSSVSPRRILISIAATVSPPFAIRAATPPPLIRPSWPLVPPLVIPVPVTPVAFPIAAPTAMSPPLPPLIVVPVPPLAPLPAILLPLQARPHRRSRRSPLRRPRGTNPARRADLDGVGAAGVPLGDGQAQGAGEGILLGLLDLAQLLPAQALALLLVRLGGVGVGVVVAVGLGVPVEVAALLPAADGGLEAVAEVVLAVGGCRDVVPAKVDAAAGAGFADCREEIHDGRGCSTQGVMEVI